ncbi:ABC transporter ATP-binding protein [Candidatus Peregrinibacteria bacterium]|jgi:ATP-binding cassette, subfamily B, bacterial|nr:ABC transporter ATP-binding protein [Candidatus Peregrinibacteria bacterium]
MFGSHYKEMLKTSWYYGRGNRGKMVVSYLMFIMANLVEMAEPIVLALLINTVQENPPDLLEKSLMYLLLLAGLSFLFWVFHGNARVIERIFSFHTVKNFQERMFKMLSRLPIKWHKDHHSGDIMSRVRKAHDGLEEFTDNGFMYIGTIVKFVTSIGAIIYLLPKYGLIALGLGIGIIFIMSKFDKVLVKNFHTINEKKHIASATFNDYISNMMTVITLRLSKLARKEVVKKVQKYLPIWKKNAIFNEVKWFTITMALASMNIIVLFAYIFEKSATEGTILVGSLIALQQYAHRFTAVFYNLAWQYEQIIHFYTDVKSTNPIRHAYENLPKRYQEEVDLGDWKKIEIKNLYFRYEDEKRNAHNLSNINLELEKGLKIALVGESGGGKSTMMSLLRGLYPANKVTVKIDDKKYDKLHILYDSVTLMPQDPEIFENTIEYNVTAGIHHTKEEAEEACRLACVDNVIKRLPKGMKTSMKEKGVNLSGGEKQRLALARGIFAAKNSDIILMDEPTSSVDSQNETKICKNIFGKFSDRCIISSVHRLNLLHMFDVIYVFSGGKLIGKGSFKNLKKENKTFQRMWKAFEKSEKK